MRIQRIKNYKILIILINHTSIDITNINITKYRNIAKK